MTSQRRRLPGCRRPASGPAEFPPGRRWQRGERRRQSSGRRRERRSVHSASVRVLANSGQRARALFQTISQRNGQLAGTNRLDCGVLRKHTRHRHLLCKMRRRVIARRASRRSIPLHDRFPPQRGIDLSSEPRQQRGERLDVAERRVEVDDAGAQHEAAADDARSRGTPRRSSRPRSAAADSARSR